MKIYEVTYLVDNLHVKGYLGLPAAYVEWQVASHVPLQHLEEAVRRAAGAPSCLPMEEVTPEPDLNHLETTEESPVTGPALTPTDLGTRVQPHESEDRLGSPPFPALLYCRGGINRVGMSRLEWIETFCHLGFVVFAPWYRGTLGTDGRDEFGGADKNDSIIGFRILQQLPGVDEFDVTILGFSRGAINATLTAVAEPAARALILWGGVADLAATYEERVDLRRMMRRVIGGTPRKVPEAYQERSPIYSVESIPCRTLVVHSTEDPQVNIHHGRDMYEALVRAGKEVAWHGYQGYAHHFDPLVRHAVMERMLAWTRVAVRGRSRDGSDMNPASGSVRTANADSSSGLGFTQQSNFLPRVNGPDILNKQ
ncbi:alpha/beta hydrolase family protein [Alicyclobacillus ferrooxydans]|uniref:alpha/beta hydrolase family protein n=1 Tax=Alicyclobacillus ferrooxydans TaxID=471514 RepID=UPI0006D53778|nr:prolyl oligopeptidase family serine peptidase [Alicyclobacillus ferrooxydans]